MKLPAGHSLGGALATLAAFAFSKAAEEIGFAGDGRLPIACYTFGCGAMPPECSQCIVLMHFAIFSLMQNASQDGLGDLLGLLLCGHPIPAQILLICLAPCLQCPGLCRWLLTPVSQMLHRAPRTGNRTFADEYEAAVPDTWHIINDQVCMSA